MKIEPIKTKRFSPPQEDVLTEILNSVGELPDCSIIAITAKIVSIDQGRCVPIDENIKDQLIKEEAELYLSRDAVPGGYVMHTITNNTLIPSAGIDASNANGYYILWPQNIEKTLQTYYKAFQKRFGVKSFGLLIVDSRSVPLRRGIVGMALGAIGFASLNDYRGRKDLFANEMVSSQVNVPDSLAASAVFTMGEGPEQTPLALLSDIPFVKFGDWEPSKKEHSTYIVAREDDIYRPLLDVDWQKGGKGVKHK